MINTSTNIKSVNIPYIHVFRDVCIYEIYILPEEERSYTVYTRYSDFLAFHNKLKSMISSSPLTKSIQLPPFPSKSSSNFDENVLMERRLLFQNYLQFLASHDQLKFYEAFIRFLDPMDGANSKTSFFMSVILENKLNKRNSFFDNFENADLHDDVTSITVSGATMKNNVVYYILEVKNAFLPETYNTWKIEKRYSEIEAFKLKLETLIKKDSPEHFLKLPKMPPKYTSFWESKYSKEFIEKRRLLLDHYFKQLVYIKPVRRMILFKEFLGL